MRFILKTTKQIFNWLVIAALLLPNFVFTPVAYAADGSGTNTVNPTTAATGSTGNTFTFTYTAAEAMGSGALRMSVPAGWSAPQGTSGTAGYTTVSTTGTIGNVLDVNDSATGWAAGTACTSGAPTADAGVKQEGVASIRCTNGNESNGDKWYKNITTQNWSGYTQIGLWVRSSVAVVAGRLSFSYDNSANLASPLETISLGALAANTWTYVVLPFGATTRTSVVSYGFVIGHASALDNSTIYSDFMLIGPGSISFSGAGPWNVDMNLLDIVAGDTVTFNYGLGGGTSGVTVPTVAVDTPYTFTTSNKIAVNGALTGIATSPIVTVLGPQANATSFINNTNGTLTDGARIGDQITIYGNGFTNGPCNGTTNVVKIGTYSIACGNISAWSPTSITISSLPAGINVYGGTGTNGLIVRGNGNDDSSPLTFYVYPDVSSLSPANTTGAREGDTVTITGTKFGTAQGTGSVKFQNCAIAGDQSAGITSWNETSIVLTVPSSIDDNDDSCDILVTQGTSGNLKTVSATTYKILPKITAFTSSAREYSALDTDGLVYISGSHFGAAGTVTLLGSAATQHATAEGACAAGGYSASSICVETPTAISDSINTGNVVVTRTADTKPDTAASTLRILPRITSLVPISGAETDAVTINGNHFCQTGTCPSAFDANNKVAFGTTDATTFTSWANTSLVTEVPVGASSGNVIITSGGLYTSNGVGFTVISSTPGDPTSLDQSYDSALARPVAIGGSSSSTPIYLSMSMSSLISGNTLYPQVEYKPTGSAFVCGASTCVAATEGTGIAGPGPVTGKVSISPTDGSYHWQARIKNVKGANTYYSNWVSFGGNPEASADFAIDTTGPAITTGPASSNVQSNSATITWSTGAEQSTTQLQYNKTGTFAACSGNCTTLDPSFVFDHTVNLNNLDSGTTYYYRARSKDAAGNETISSNGTFNTSSVTQPSKSTKFYAMGLGDVVAGGSATSTDFSVYVSETSYGVKSAFIELAGTSLVNGTNNIQVQVNGQAAKTYAIASNQSSFKIVYKIDSANINVDPTLNTLTITPDQDTYVASAKITITYAYTP